MENQDTRPREVVGNELSRQAISELDLLTTLNIGYETLGRLRRGKGFPVVYLDQRNRVYLVDEVVAWLKRNRGVKQDGND